MGRALAQLEKCHFSDTSDSQVKQAKDSLIFTNTQIDQNRKKTRNNRTNPVFNR
ncbi:hypothetical protein YSA_07545 [Pseudomonas putida ND6]|uniref:Uncharacterized protein n=1 Tax=Pseudomonas putida ND6 TaxID=231023 RepID=I3UZB9_PSEPU|nr:hypothetical protein YSA_07545 [Pseudomonas putida ND6]